MSGTEFAAGKVKLLQLTLSYLFQSVNFQLVYSVSNDPLTFQYMFGSPVLEWPAAKSSIQLHPCNAYFIFSPSGYHQHGQQEEVAWDRIW
jgi:hypothetical protein